MIIFKYHFQSQITTSHSADSQVCYFDFKQKKNLNKILN